MSVSFDGKFTVSTTERCVNVSVNPDFYADVRRRYPDDMPPYRPEVSDCGCENCIARLVFSQLRQSLESGITSEAYYESKVVELTFLLGADCPIRTSLPESDWKAVDTAKRIICSRLADCPKIPELAVMTGTSPSKLQSDFKAAFGQTISGYLRETRMAKALDLLQRSDAPVYAVALEVGCRKAGRFSEMFKKTFGLSPTEYRRISGNERK